MRSGQQWLLETADGRKTQYDPYRVALLRAVDGLDIPGKMTTHRLRHTYATSLLSGGMSLLGVMKLLGHRDYHMTLRYTDITQETVGKEYFEALTQLEKRYRQAIHRGSVSELNPVTMIADVVRWLRKNTATDQSLKRTAALLIRRLERIQKELSTLVYNQLG